METIILASGSPRRQELLTRVRIPFKAFPPNIDEEFDHLESVACFAVCVQVRRKRQRAISGDGKSIRRFPSRRHRTSTRHRLALRREEQPQKVVGAALENIGGGERARGTGESLAFRLMRIPENADTHALVKDGHGGNGDLVGVRPEARPILVPGSDVEVA